MQGIEILAHAKKVDPGEKNPTFGPSKAMLLSGY